MVEDAVDFLEKTTPAIDRCEAAQEALTDMNAPSGDCPICLLELDVDAEAAG